MSGRAVYLDRDGVLNRAAVREGKPYPPATLKQLKILPGVSDALARLRAAGFRLVVVTNQPDVARGSTPLAIVEAIHAYMWATLPLDAIEVCLHSNSEGCDCRKPRPGMLLRDAARHDIDITRSFMVGDRWRDIDAGAAAGCCTILIDAGYDERAPAHAPNHVCRSLPEVAEWILRTGNE